MLKTYVQGAAKVFKVIEDILEAELKSNVDGIYPDGDWGLSES